MTVLWDTGAAVALVNKRDQWHTEAKRRLRLLQKTKARLLLQYTDKNFSYVDATSFAVMERHGLQTAFTFDQHFARYQFAIYGE